MKDDRFYMNWAMMLAQNAFEAGYSPVGCVIRCSSDGDGIFYAQSQREIGNIKHAEFRALTMVHEQADMLEDFIVYSTLEPCIMCAGMATVMKASRIVVLRSFS